MTMSHLQWQDCKAAAAPKMAAGVRPPPPLPPPTLRLTNYWHHRRAARLIDQRIALAEPSVKLRDACKRHGGLGVISSWPSPEGEPKAAS